MKFTIETNELKNGLESVQVKGKGTTNNGFGNTNLGTYALLEVKDNNLSIWNGNQTFFVSLTIPLEGESEEGICCLDSANILPYLKSFSNEITFSVGDFITITSGDSKKASIPLVVNHPQIEPLTRIKGMLSHVRYEVNPNRLWTFGKGQFETAFTITQAQFKSAIKTCELVKSGIYKLDKNETITLSTRQSITNKYEETLTPLFITNPNEGATIEFSSPIYAFFEKDQMLNIYMKDEFPLLIVANDRILLKAPHIGA